jgi:hypothetical protein
MGCRGRAADSLRRDESADGASPDRQESTIRNEYSRKIDDGKTFLRNLNAPPFPAARPPAATKTSEDLNRREQSQQRLEPFSALSAASCFENARSLREC